MQVPEGESRASDDRSAAVRYRFDQGVVIPARNLIVISDRRVILEPRAMEVLELLVSRGGLVVSKQELLDGVWQGRFVGDESLAVYIYELRKALGDDARRPRYLETVRKRGYRWIPPVTVEPEWPNAAPARGSDSPPAGSDSAARVTWRSVVGLALLFTAALALSAHGSRPAVPSPTDTELATVEIQRGNELLRSRGGELLRAEACYRRAIDLDPSLSQGWGSLSLTLALMAEIPMRDRFELYHGAKTAAETALELDSRNVQAHIGLAVVELTVDLNRERAYWHIGQAIRQGPGDSRAWEVRSWLDVAEGLEVEAVAAIHEAQRLDPLSSKLHTLLALVHRLSGDEDSMQASLDRAWELASLGFDELYSGWLILWPAGHHEEAVALLFEALHRVTGREERVAELETAYQLGGFPELLETYGNRLPEHSALVEKARIALFLGQRDEALDLLERAMAQRESELVWIARFPEFRELHGDARFQAIVRRIDGEV